MSRRKQSTRTRNRIRKKKQGDMERRPNKTLFKALLGWLIPKGVLFTKDRFHGNTKWTPEQLAQEAVIWAWQDARNVTDAFAMAMEACEELKIKHAAKTHTAFINGLDRHRETFSLRLGRHFQASPMRCVPCGNACAT